MRAMISVTKRFFAEIWSDAMMAALIFVPVIAGLAFRFGAPALESYLCAKLELAYVLTPYYSVFDLLLAFVTPIMFTAAGALVILDEADAGLIRAIAVTPVGKTGYLISRIAVPACIATLYCIIVLAVFKLTELSAATILLLAVCSGALGVVVALMIPALSKNKVEGMAYSKLSGLFVLGLPVAILVSSPARYIAGILPTFWAAELITSGGWNACPALLTAAIWAYLFYKRFINKLL